MAAAHGSLSTFHDHAICYPIVPSRVPAARFRCRILEHGLRYGGRVRRLACKVGRARCQGGRASRLLLRCRHRHHHHADGAGGAVASAARACRRCRLAQRACRPRPEVPRGALELLRDRPVLDGAPPPLQLRAARRCGRGVPQSDVPPHDRLRAFRHGCHGRARRTDLRTLYAGAADGSVADLGPAVVVRGARSVVGRIPRRCRRCASQP